MPGSYAKMICALGLAIENGNAGTMWGPYLGIRSEVSTPLKCKREKEKKM